MARMTLIALILASISVGCSVMAPPPVVWVEGESYSEGPRNVTEGIGKKPPCSGGRVLFGAVLSAKGGYARYHTEIHEDIADARMLIRYSRHHWRPMDAAEITVTLTSPDHGLTRTAVLDKTGGWGGKNKAEWGLATVPIGTLGAGDWMVQFSAIAERHGDVNIDGFFLIPGEMDITAAELNAADRIHITGWRYVGAGVPSAIIHQQDFDGFELPARAFGPIEMDVTVTVLDAAGQPVAVLLDAADVPLNDRSRAVLVSGDVIAALPDGEYTIRTAWGSAPIMDVPVFLVGQLAADFPERLAAIVEAGGWLASSEVPAHAAFVADYKHAGEFLAAAWERVAAGTADRATLASVRRVLAQYAETTEMIKADQPPYARRTGDFRLAFVSAATGRLEEYRIFLPDSYSPAGKTPLLMALNHNVNKYLDQADGTTKRIANQRGYAILAPGAVGTDGETADYWDDGDKDLLQLLTTVLANYPGLDRTRVYCTGTSRGGFGTYSFATEHPEFFAAIACASGTGNWTRGDDGQRVLEERFAPLPTLILHGEIDNLVSQDIAKEVAAKLAEAGIDHELHIFPSYGHSYENYCEQFLTISLDYFGRYPKSELAESDPVASQPATPEPTPPAEVPAAAREPETEPEAGPPAVPADAPEPEAAPEPGPPATPAEPAETPQTREATPGVV